MDYMTVGLAHIGVAGLLGVAYRVYCAHCEGCWSRILHMIDSPQQVARLTYLTLPWEPPLTNVVPDPAPASELDQTKASEPPYLREPPAAPALAKRPMGAVQVNRGSW